MQFGAFPVDKPSVLIGAVLAHSTTDADGRRIAKGTLLDAAIVQRLADAGHMELTVAVPGADDLREDDAAAKLAKALGGANVRIGPAGTGRVNLCATADGVCCFDRQAILAFNQVDPCVTLATLPDFEKVDAGQMIATIKIIPFAVARKSCEMAIGALNGKQINVAAFDKTLKVSLIQTKLGQTKSSVLAKTQTVTRDRLAACGIDLSGSSECMHDVDLLLAALKQHQSNNDLLIVFGASAICDAQDVIPDAIRQAGGQVDYIGMPVDPGNLLLLGRLNDTTIIGAPGCARSAKLNGFDWVLQRKCARLPVSAEDMVAMSVGGLLTEIPSRPSPRERK